MSYLHQFELSNMVFCIYLSHFLMFSFLTPSFEGSGVLDRLRGFQLTIKKLESKLESETGTPISHEYHNYSN